MGGTPICKNRQKFLYIRDLFMMQFWRFLSKMFLKYIMMDNKHLVL